MREGTNFKTGAICGLYAVCAVYIKDWMLLPSVPPALPLIPVVVDHHANNSCAPFLLFIYINESHKFPQINNPKPTDEISDLVRYLSSNDAQTQRCAAYYLSQLTADSDSQRTEALNEGALIPLITIIN